MRFFAPFIFVLFFSLAGFAQQSQNQVKNPNMVQPRRSDAVNPDPVKAEKRQPVDHNKTVPSKRTVRDADNGDTKPTRKPVQSDPNKVVRKQ
jgi:hypothetical protein